MNDKHGHHVGDEVLKKLSDLLKKNFRLGKHVVSRWGGDKFAIIYYREKEELVQRLGNIKEVFKTYISAYEKTTGISISIVPLRCYDKASQT